MASLRDALTYEPVELGFGTSGLRALVTDMTDLECYLNAAGFLAFVAATGEFKPGATVYVAGDLRDSTPRILRAVMSAVRDGGYVPVYLGLIPTPALALKSIGESAPGIMVTGSHIPADRNGIKFYKPAGEVMKADEGRIHAAVAMVRARLYEQGADESAFTVDGSLKVPGELPEIETAGRNEYLDRYVRAFGSDRLTGKKVVFYQHSAVGRDDLVELLGRLGAEVVPVGRSEVFVPIDSENVTAKHQAYFKQLAAEHPDAFAIISTDGDSDRPFVIDATGVFHRGDVLGAVVVQWLGAEAAALPVSSSDAATQWLDQHDIAWTYTKIGSPYVVEAMQAQLEAGRRSAVGWEVNGGFLTGSAVTVGGQTLSALPTRDAALPIIVALVAAAEARVSVAEVFAELPKRFTQAGLIDDFPQASSKAIVAAMAEDNEDARRQLAQFFEGFGPVKEINTLDGARIFFANGEIAHIRPSGNAPQLRIYSVADTQERADEIVALALAEPDGILRRLGRKYS